MVRKKERKIAITEGKAKNPGKYIRIYGWIDMRDWRMWTGETTTRGRFK